MKCPFCGLINPDTALRCDCGYDFAAGQMTIEQLPPTATVRPQVIKWFRVYCWVLCVLYLAVAAFSLLFFIADPAELEMSRAGCYAVGVGILSMGLGLLVASLLPLVLRPRPWLWTYDLVIICGGMTSPFFLPACIPLLIFWLKPEAKRHFGKT